MNLPLRLAAVALAALALAGCETLSPPLTSTAVRTQIGSTAQADSVIDRWIDAIGGVQALRQLRSLETEQEFQIEPGNRTMKAHVTRVASGAYRFDATLENGTRLSEAFDGVTAWRRYEPYGFGMISPEELYGTLEINDFVRPLRVRQFYPSRHMLADVVLDGRQCRVVAMTGRDRVTETWYFDAQEGTLRRVERPATASGAQAVTMDYLDYRSVEGWKFPFVTRQSSGSNALGTRFSSMMPNGAVHVASFTPPANLMRDAGRVDGILARYLTSIGGSAIDRVTSRVTTSNVAITSSGVTLRTTLSQKRPNLFLNEQDTPGMGHAMQGFDGKTGWANSDLQGFRTLKGEELQQLLTSSALASDARLAQRYPMRRLLGERVVNGRLTEAIALGSMQGIAGTYYFDEENGRLLRVESLVAAGPQSTIRATLDYSDFREVNGVTMPFTSVLTNPALRVVTTVQSVQNNVPLDDTIFQPRKE